jgi:hypothetical protein
LFVLTGVLPHAAQASAAAATSSLSAEALFNQGNAYRESYLRSRTLSYGVEDD